VRDSRRIWLDTWPRRVEGARIARDHFHLAAVDFARAIADADTARAFGDITAVPTHVLFDRQGRTASVSYGAPPDLHEQVEKRLKALLG